MNRGSLIPLIVALVATSAAHAQVNVNMNTMNMTIPSGRTVTLPGNITLPNNNRIWATGTLRISSTSATAIVAGATAGIVHEETALTGGVEWNMQQAAAYTIPFMNTSAQAVPVVITPGAASASARYVKVGTYASASNNTPFPTTVTNVNWFGNNWSANMPDRFWAVNSSTATSYTMKFTYGAAEDATGGTTSMKGQAWLNGWDMSWASQSQTATREVQMNGYGLPAATTRYFSLAQSPGVSVSVKAFLDGPFNSGAGTMNDGLRSAGLIFNIEPYTGLGFTMLGGSDETMGSGVLSTTGNNAIVDWVLLELRDQLDPSNILRTAPALIQRDGDVVSAADGVSPVTFSTAGPGYYYVALRHRNHFGVMTSTIPYLSSAPASIDLTQPATGVYGTNARRTVGSVMTLWSGNVHRDTQIKYTGANNDRDPILVAIGGTVPTNTISAYSSADVNMDGIVKYTGANNDRDPILVNIGGTLPTNVITEQLP